MASKKAPASASALGGRLAALAVVVMSLGTALMIGTYACPMVAIMLLKIVLNACGKRMAWAWYGAVAILSALLAPDKEAAAVFIFLGYYPILKPWLDKRRVSWAWKGLVFNGAIFGMYWLLMNFFGFSHLAEEFYGMGLIMLLVLLILGNVTFFLLDRLLGMQFRKR